MSWKEIKTTRSYLLWPFTLHVIIVKSRICGLNEAHCAWKRLKEQQPKDQRPWNSYNTYLTSSPVLLFSAKLCKWFCTTSSIYRKRATKKKQEKNSSTEASGGDRDGAGEAKKRKRIIMIRSSESVYRSDCRIQSFDFNLVQLNYFSRKKKKLQQKEIWRMKTFSRSRLRQEPRLIS